MCNFLGTPSSRRAGKRWIENANLAKLKLHKEYCANVQSCNVFTFTFTFTSTSTTCTTCTTCTTPPTTSRSVSWPRVLSAFALGTRWGILATRSRARRTVSREAKAHFAVVAIPVRCKKKECHSFQSLRLLSFPPTTEPSKCQRKWEFQKEWRLETLDQACFAKLSLTFLNLFCLHLLCFRPKLTWSLLKLR